MSIAVSTFAKAVIDTGPLFTALTLEFLQENPDSRNIVLHKHKPPDYLGDPTAEASFRSLFRSIKRLLITSHVIGELRSRYKVPGNIHREFWLSAMKTLSHRGLDEELLTLLELYDDDALKEIVSISGPTDAGLVALAHREGCLLLTDDGRLFRWMGVYPSLRIGLIQNLLV